MAKKKKDKSKKDSSPTPKKGPLILLILIIAVALAGAFNPGLINLDSLKSILATDPNSATASATLQGFINSTYHIFRDRFLDFAHKANLPTKFENMPEEIVVDNVVASFSQEIKDLPLKQVQKIKTQICQDVINQATATISGNQTP
jgi:hypothetical protein